MSHPTRLEALAYLPMKTDPAFISATELLCLYRSRSLSPFEVAQACLDRIAALDTDLNAFALIDGDAALEAARASEERWIKGEPLGLVDGVPATIKDLILTKGWPTLRGSKAVSPDQPWEEDAPATARLREHGAVLLGKTTTPELGHKGVTDSPLYGITRNPWNPDMTPGGSSGGSAAALAARLGPLALGSGGAGSIRLPGGFTGLPGLKPTCGRVPLWPPSAFGTVSHAGPMARTVTDVALLLDVMCEPDPRDWTALPPPTRSYLDGLDDGIAGIRVAFSADLGYVSVDPEVAAAVERAAGGLAELGAHVERVEPG